MGYRADNLIRFLIYNRILRSKQGGKTRTEQAHIAYMDRLDGIEWFRIG